LYHETLKDGFINPNIHMPTKVLIITPPFTQLNTPYPATMYLKGFLNTLGIESRQADIGIEVIHRLFNVEILQKLFLTKPEADTLSDENLMRIYQLRNRYIATIDPVMAFLSGKNRSLAYTVILRNYLPEAKRFENFEDTEETFGDLGIIDKAKHMATLYLEDLGDYITATVDPHFGFNRYAESISRSASSFDLLSSELEKEDSIVSTLTKQVLDEHIHKSNPGLVCITCPFPGNLFSALKCGQFIKQEYPTVKVCLGGGYVNTELRSINDERLFEYIDFVCLDDGEMPLTALIEYLDGKRPLAHLKRTFLKDNGVVQFINGAPEKDIAQRETGTPDYSDLYLDKYLTILEVTNAMHRLWSDGRWNKLTLAHGCYWGKCSFCDISLDYIARYEPITASILCDRIEAIIKQTGENGFHFVDEAAPPALMGELALEIIKRKLTVVWWTNIRFEKSFTYDLCQLLRASGCIAVSGGLEVASDRLLALMKKGVTIEQVTKVAGAFTDAGIMVHAYLMYGFPTQTDQETIDSLEVVRQMFEANILQSGFWHRFAMTSHSPVGIDPAAYGVQKIGPIFEGFADNDNDHLDPKGGDHDAYGEGLRVSLYNYMNGVGFDIDLQQWFGDYKVPRTTHKKNMIQTILNQNHEIQYRPNANVIYTGIIPTVMEESDSITTVLFYIQQEEVAIDLERDEAEWLLQILPEIAYGNKMAFSDFSKSYEVKTGFSFEEFMACDLWPELKEMGLLVV
jgi:hypothetical protein